MKINPLVSVIIPAYNCEKTILATIESVNSQDYANLEIIAVDDGSRDDTLELLYQLKAKSNIPFKILSQDNVGVATTRNNGVAESNGEYIAFLDSDDVWVNNKISIQVAIVNELYPLGDFGLLATTFSGINLNLNRLLKVHDKVYQVTFKQLLVKHYFQPSTTLISKHAFISVGGFKEGMTHAEEGLLFYKLTYKYNSYITTFDSIVYGDGKHPFLDSGLASNLVNMEKGELANLKDIYVSGYISPLNYAILVCFSLIKFSRRLMLKFLKVKA